MDGRIEILKETIQVARGEKPPEQVLRNARVMNVFSGEIYGADVAVKGGLSAWETIRERAKWISRALF